MLYGSVIENGNSWVPIPVTSPSETGTSTGTKMTVPSTAEEKTCKKNDVKARILLLMALPNEHQLTFDQYVDASIHCLLQLKLDYLEGMKQQEKTKRSVETTSMKTLMLLSSESLDSIFKHGSKVMPSYAFLSLKPQGSSQLVADKDLDSNFLDDDLKDMDYEVEICHYLALRNAVSIREWKEKSSLMEAILGSQIMSKEDTDDSLEKHQKTDTENMALVKSSFKVDIDCRKSFSDGVLDDEDDDELTKVEKKLSYLLILRPRETKENWTCWPNNRAQSLDFKDFDGVMLLLVEEPMEAELLAKGSNSKPHNILPYELFRGFKPAIGFMKPFGCHVTILNTLDKLGKFDGKSDEGFFVGYSSSSKAFRVYNTRTRKVQENLHFGFLEKKPMMEGNGPKWLFDLDSLTQSMNYVPVVAGTFSNDFAEVILVVEMLVNWLYSEVNMLTLEELVEEAMQEELLKVSNCKRSWISVDLPKGHTELGYKVDLEEEHTEMVELCGPTISCAWFSRGKIGLIRHCLSREKGTYLACSKYMWMTLSFGSTRRRFQVSPKTSHLLAVKRIFRYLKGKPSLGLWKVKPTGGCQFLENRLISWQCKKQTVVAISTIEAEYVAAANCCGHRSAEATTDDNGEVQITATIDGHSMTMTEASLRRHLKLDDHDGITSIPNSEIFEQLALMGYHTDSDKLTFQKGAFSPQWRFLIHTILHCLSLKKTAWEQFSSNIATAVICLIYIFQPLLSLTFHPSHSPCTFNLKHSPDHTTAAVSFPSLTQPTQPSPETEQHIPTPHDSPLYVVYSHGNDEGSLKLIELTNLVTKLFERIGVLEDDLKKTKLTYRKEQRFVLSEDDKDVEDDSSKQGRKSDAEVQGKASTKTEPIIQEVTPTEVIQDQGSSEKGESELYCRANKGTASKVLMKLEQERLSFAKAIRLQEQMNEEQRAQIARDEEIAR
ncbi:retrovirus-related pol polyprotein from transposon TNT 1-94 [Tanacetum coccineum]|uniref:Retrovirus-related pol polyprotein from transposon TNT 1-94 n=1 Tax=Tanacetum coccineum TaxID=301880 RepID=A0ABQ5HI52_9ASTR